MRYQKILSQLWHDEKVKAINPMEQRLFFYVLTCPHGNLLGLFVLKEGYCLSDLKCLKKDFRRNLKALIDIGLIKYDENNEVVYIPNFLKHNPITNPNQRKACNKIFRELPKSFLLSEFLKKNNGLIEGLSEELLEELNEGLNDSFRNQIQIQNTETEVSASPKDLALDFIDKIKNNPAYDHINIENELSKMDAWLSLPKNKGRKKTSHFILNWLNKIEKPYPSQEYHKTERENPTIIPEDFVPDPHGQERLKEIIASISKEKDIPKIDEEERKKLLREQANTLIK